MTIWITLSWLMGYDVDGDYAQWNKVMKIYFMTFVALALLHNKHHTMAFVWVSTMSLALLGAKGGVFTVLSGGAHKVWGPTGSFIADNNHFALALIMAEGAASAFVGVASGVRPPHAPTNETDTRTVVVASLERMKRR